MRGKFKPRIHGSAEVELDLAPLLAVMVKLVPVLLISSAFVQVMMVETDLPQVVKEAIQNQDNLPKKTTVGLEVSRAEGFKITTLKDGQTFAQAVPVNAAKELDYVGLHKALQKVKTDNPEVFRIELSPEPSITQKEIVKVMDEARKSRNKDVKFIFVDSKKNEEVQTDFMFPDVVFANMME